MSRHIKIAITGAGGQIGYAFLFRLASGQAFGPDVTLDLHLLEVEAAVASLSGVAMELMDCAFPLLRNIKISSNADEAFSGVNWVVCIGAAPRTLGMERADLLAKNGGIFTRQGKAINNFAADDVKILVVGNPCNTNALIAMKNAPDIPPERFFAMTRLDQNRGVAQLAEKAQAQVMEVKNLIIWGNHSATQYPDFYHATINNIPVPEVISDQVWLKETFIARVQQRGTEVLKARGASSVASAANGIIDSLWSLTHDTASDQTYSVACYSQGQYGIDPGLIFSFPCQTKNGEIKIIEGWKHNEFGKMKLQTTLNELKEEYEIVKQLGLI